MTPFEFCVGGGAVGAISFLALLALFLPADDRPAVRDDYFEGDW